MLIQGSSKRAIALYLNEHGVPSPSAYKVQKGLPVSTRGYDDPMWGARMIHSILEPGFHPVGVHVVAAGKQFHHSSVLLDLILMYGHSNQCRQAGGG